MIHIILYDLSLSAKILVAVVALKNENDTIETFLEKYDALLSRLTTSAFLISCVSKLCADRMQISRTALNYNVAPASNNLEIEGGSV